MAERARAVPTSRVVVEGDVASCDAVVLTYHDCGQNHLAFSSFFSRWRADLKAFVHRLCIVHVDAPGQCEDAEALPEDVDHLDMSSLSEEVYAILEERKLLGEKPVIGFGIGAGAHVLLRVAAAHPYALRALVLFGVSARKCGWFEWGHEKMSEYLLRYTPLGDFWVDYFLSGWFSAETRRARPLVTDSFRRMVLSHPTANLLKFVHGYQKRQPIDVDQLSKLRPFTLMFVGDNTPLETDAVKALGCMPHDGADLVRVPDCGAMVLEERPEVVQEAVELLFKQLGFVF